MFVPLLNKFINLTAVPFTKNMKGGMLRWSWQNQNEKYCLSNEYLAIGMIFQQYMKSTTKKGLFVCLVTLKLYEPYTPIWLTKERQQTVLRKEWKDVQHILSKQILSYYILTERFCLSYIYK